MEVQDRERSERDLHFIDLFPGKHFGEIAAATGSWAGTIGCLGSAVRVALCEQHLSMRAGVWRTGVSTPTQTRPLYHSTRSVAGSNQGEGFLCACSQRTPAPESVWVQSQWLVASFSEAMAFAL